MGLLARDPARMVLATTGLPGETVPPRRTQLEQLLEIGRRFGDRAVPHGPRERRTPVLMLARNAESFLKACFGGMRCAVTRGCADAGHPPPRWYVYENDSTDRTATVLKHYADVVVCSDRLPPELRPAGGAAARSAARCGPMAAMRNALRVMALRDLQVQGATAIVVDVDVWFSSRTIAALLRERRAHGLDVAAAHTRETAHHYFDTYALVLPGEEPADVFQRKDCHVARCRECVRNRADQGNAHRPRHVRLDPRGVTPVTSAFGGLAAIRAATLRGAEGPWRSDPPGLCEHVAMCKGRKVAIVNDATARWSAVFLERVAALYCGYWRA